MSIRHVFVYVCKEVAEVGLQACGAYMSKCQPLERWKIVGKLQDG